MSEIINKFLLAGDKFTLEMDLRQPGFEKTGDTSYIYKKELDKACFNMIWLMEILKI